MSDDREASSVRLGRYDDRKEKSSGFSSTNAGRENEKPFQEDSMRQKKGNEKVHHMADHEVLPGTAHNSEDATSYQKRWAELYGRLVAFKEKHGHCRVPNRYDEDPQLGYWVSTQRRQYRLLETATDTNAVPLSAERAKKLEDIGFEWNAVPSSHKSWDGRYAELCDFVEKHGHAQVPMGYEENPRLATWVSTQRQEYKLLKQGRSSRLSEEKKKKLEEVGFVWEAQRGRRKSKQNDTTKSQAAGKVEKKESTLQKKEASKPCPNLAQLSSPPKESPRSINVFVQSLTHSAETGVTQQSRTFSDQCSTPAAESEAQAQPTVARADAIQSPLDLVATAAHQRIMLMQAQEKEKKALSSETTLGAPSADQVDELHPDNKVRRQANGSEPAIASPADFASSSLGSGLLTGFPPRPGFLASCKVTEDLRSTQATDILGAAPKIGADRYLNNDSLLHQLSQQRMLQGLEALQAASAQTAERNVIYKLASEHPGLKRALDELEQAERDVVRELVAVGFIPQANVLVAAQANPEADKQKESTENKEKSTGMDISSDRKRSAIPVTSEREVKRRA